jgi:hypothetical protein
MELGLLRLHNTFFQTGVTIIEAMAIMAIMAAGNVNSSLMLDGLSGCPVSGEGHCHGFSRDLSPDINDNSSNSILFSFICLKQEVRSRVVRWRIELTQCQQ